MNVSQNQERYFWLATVFLVIFAFTFYLKALVPVYQKQAELNRLVQEQKLASVVDTVQQIERRIDKLESGEVTPLSVGDVEKASRNDYRSLAQRLDQMQRTIDSLRLGR